jgi:hypothetical protein
MKQIANSKERRVLNQVSEVFGIFRKLEAKLLSKNILAELKLEASVILFLSGYQLQSFAWMPLVEVVTVLSSGSWLHFRTCISNFKRRTHYSSKIQLLIQIFPFNSLKFFPFPFCATVL